MEKTFLCWRACGRFYRGLTAVFVRVLKGLGTWRTFWDWGRWGRETSINLPLLNPPLWSLEQRRATMIISFCKIFLPWFIHHQPPLYQLWNRSYKYFFWSTHLHVSSVLRRFLINQKMSLQQPNSLDAYSDVQAGSACEEHLSICSCFSPLWRPVDTS